MFDIDVALAIMETRFNHKLDELHQKVLQQFRTLTRSTGQRTRVVKRK